MKKGLFLGKLSNDLTSNPLLPLFLPISWGHTFHYIFNYKNPHCWWLKFQQCHLPTFVSDKKCGMLLLLLTITIILQTWSFIAFNNLCVLPLTLRQGFIDLLQISEMPVRDFRWQIPFFHPHTLWCAQMGLRSSWINCAAWFLAVINRN